MLIYQFHCWCRSPQQVHNNWTCWRWAF